MTPELWPLWWAAIVRRARAAPGRGPARSRSRARAVARPTIPPPTTTTSTRPAVGLTAPRPAPRRGVAVERGLDLGPRRRPVLEVAGDGELLGLEVLVDVEEVLDLGLDLVGEVADVVDVLPPRLVGLDADHLGVAAGLVLHPHHADGAGVDPAAGEGGVLGEHQHVERVAVLGEGVGDEPVLGRVGRRREEAAVEPDPTRVVIDLVLVPAPAGDLDQHVDGLVHGGPLCTAPDAPAGPARLWHRPCWTGEQLRRTGALGPRRPRLHGRGRRAAGGPRPVRSVDDALPRRPGGLLPRRPRRAASDWSTGPSRSSSASTPTTSPTGRCSTSPTPTTATRPVATWPAWPAGAVESVEVQKRYLRADGSSFWGLLRAKPLLGPDGSPVALLGSIVDISQQVEVTAALEASEHRLQALLSHTDAVIVADGEARLSYASPRRRGASSGYSAAEMLGTSVLDLVHPDDRRGRRRSRSSTRSARVAPQRPLQFRVAHRRRRQTVSVEVAGHRHVRRPVRQRAGRHASPTSPTAADPEVASTLSERRFRTLLLNTSDTVTLLDADGHGDRQPRHRDAHTRAHRRLLAGAEPRRAHPPRRPPGRGRQPR